MKLKKGFTLIEILISIGIIAILVGTTITMINPGEKMAQARDDLRKNNLNAIFSAVEQKFFMDTGWDDCPEIPTDNFTTIGSGTGNYDLFSCLIPTYMTRELYDPKEGSIEDTKYMIKKNPIDGKIELISLLSERRYITVGLTGTLLNDGPVDGLVKTGGLINYTDWTVGSGSEVGFSCNGSASENYRILGEDPWGRNTVIWEAQPDDVSGADGGWYTPAFPIDNTKMHRFSVWVKRSSNSNGRFYLGTNGFGSVSGVLSRSNGSNYTNPYFWTNITSFDLDKWYLIVGHVWPKNSGTGVNYSDSGRYTVEDGRVGDISLDFVWREETTTARHRSYLYYGTDTSQRQYWVYPRVDVIDGTEPSIQDLLDGFDSYFN